MIIISIFFTGPFRLKKAGYGIIDYTMAKIAVVEDSDDDANRFLGFIEKYGQENQQAFLTTRFRDPLGLLDNYKADYDIIFLDIRMPYMDGMAAAREIRKKDQEVILIFITSLAQFAVSGYQVDALDFVIKPIDYPSFSLKMQRALSRVHTKEDQSLLILCQGNKQKILVSDITYVESLKHHVLFHTTKGNFETYDSITAVEKKPGSKEFSRCNNCYLVHLKYVDHIKGYDVKVANDLLQISQPRKKAFQEALVTYLEGA